MVADAVFDQDDDGIVVVLVEEVPEDEEDHAREAVKLCPSQALRLADKLHAPVDGPDRSNSPNRVRNLAAVRRFVAVESMTPARTSSSTLTTSTQIGNARVSHMLISLAIRSPTATR